MFDPTVIKELQKCRRLAIVPRWVVIPTIQKQSVAEHSYHVTVLSKYVAAFHVNRTTRSFVSNVVNYALRHDMYEAIEGDTPGPTKKGRKNPGDLSPHENVVKIADILEALLFLYDDQALGNGCLEPVVANVMADGEQHWEFFQWDMTLGPKLVFSDVVDELRNVGFKTHPVLEGK